MDAHAKHDLFQPPARGKNSVMMDEGIIRMLLEYHEGLFPKNCPNCGRHFATLREYLLTTQQLERVLSYDAESNDYEPLDPIGIFTMANCPCGTTMALSTANMPLWQTHQILGWIRAETEQNGVALTRLLNCVRDEIRKRILAT